MCDVAIGHRRNYLFAGADSGGERAAALNSLIGTAKLNGVDPEAWLRHLLTHICSGSRLKRSLLAFDAFPGSD